MTDTSSLLASLTGPGSGTDTDNVASGEEDLFGEIPLETPMVSSTPAFMMSSPPAASVQAPPSQIIQGLPTPQPQQKYQPIDPMTVSNGTTNGHASKPVIAAENQQFSHLSMLTSSEPKVQPPSAPASEAPAPMASSAPVLAPIVTGGTSSLLAQSGLMGTMGNDADSLFNNDLSPSMAQPLASNEPLQKKAPVAPTPPAPLPVAPTPVAVHAPPPPRAIVQAANPLDFQAPTPPVVQAPVPVLEPTPTFQKNAPVVQQPPAPTQGQPLAPVQPMSSVQPTVPSTTSLLSQSGLLGTASSGANASLVGETSGGGGLFDDIDEEEERKMKERQEQQRRAQEEEQNRQLAEKQMREQQEQARLQQQQQQIQQQQQMLLQQQQQQQQRMAMQQQQQQQMAMQQQQQLAANPNSSMYSLEGRMQDMQLGTQQQQVTYNNRELPHQKQPALPNSTMQQQRQQLNNPMYNSMPAINQPLGGVTYRDQQQTPNMLQASPGMNGRPMGSNVAASFHGGTGKNTYTYRGAPANNLYKGGASTTPMGGSVMSAQTTATAARYYQTPVPGKVNAGMHSPLPNPQQYGMANGQQTQPVQKKRVSVVKPAPAPTAYGQVAVGEPMLIQPPGSMFGVVKGSPYWSYQITTQISPQSGGGSWLVRRRFRHVVALEDRLREEVPGAILPPRPDKHVSRALEEASTQQSAEFAIQRAAELDTYLNALVQHPEVCGSHSLKLFLGLQDDMGTAWPEVSGNALTRFSAVGVSTAVRFTETTSSAGFFSSATASPGAPAGVTVGEDGAVTEDSAEMLALQSNETLRIGAVLQAIPKLEGAITLLREQGEGSGAVGMELNKLSKEVFGQGDQELSVPFEILSNGLLRYGRRTKRLGLELSATMVSFQIQYKLCRYEKLAWQDRRSALTKERRQRGRADVQARHLMHQQQFPPNMHQANPHNMQPRIDQLEHNAVVSDGIASDASRECKEIGDRLKREVNRIAYVRRMEWSKSVRVIASAMKEACSERRAIWESTRASFLQAFPEGPQQEQASVASFPVTPMQGQQQPFQAEQPHQMQPQFQPHSPAPVQQHPYNLQYSNLQT